MASVPHRTLPHPCYPAHQDRIMIKKELLEILACPQCKGLVELNAEGNGIACRHCKLLYEIRDDIPIMLIDEAKPLEEKDVE
jgi:uncharacterized protein